MKTLAKVSITRGHLCASVPQVQNYPTIHPLSVLQENLFKSFNTDITLGLSARLLRAEGPRPYNAECCGSIHTGTCPSPGRCYQYNHAIEINISYTNCRCISGAWFIVRMGYGYPQHIAIALTRIWYIMY